MTSVRQTRKSVHFPNSSNALSSRPVILAADLRKIARARLADAEALYRTNRFDGSVYLCGYAVELSLKYRICKTLGWSDFPSTGGEFKQYQTFRTHDLDVLLHLCGREARI